MMVIHWKRIIFSLIAVALVLILLNDANAAEGELIRSITNKFESVTNSWHGNLRPYVIRLFWALAAISFTYNAITMTLRGADFPDIMIEIVKMILLFGLWIYIIENSIDIVNAIINSLTRSANIAAGVSSDITPGTIINNGIDLSSKIIEQAGFWDTPIYGIIALVTLIAYLYIAATVFVVLIESYIVTGAGIILLGFAGSPWTSDIAKKYLIFAFSVGIKLFATIMVARFGEELVRDQLTATSAMKQIFAVCGVVCMIAYLTNRVPAMAQSMLSGTSSSSPGDVRGVAATAAKAAAVGTLAAVGAGAGIYQAGKAAANEIKGRGGITDTLSAASMPGSSSSSNSNSDSGVDNDKGAIPDAVASSASTPATSSAESSKTNFEGSASSQDSRHENSDESGSAVAASEMTPTVTPTGGSSSPSKLRGLASNAGKTAATTPEFLRKTAANLAKGTASAAIENIQKPKSQRTPFSVARKIYEQSLSRQINSFGEKG